jgi:hypothetical protein
MNWWEMRQGLIATGAQDDGSKFRIALPMVH